MNNITKLKINPPCPYQMPSKKLENSLFSEFCTFQLGLSPSKILGDIERWVEEDHGCGDSTLFSGFSQDTTMQFYIVAKQDFTLCGLSIMQQVFRMVSNNSIELYSNFKEGDHVQKGNIVLAGIGKCSSLLLSERVALNFGSRMSGIATKTKSILNEIKKYNENVFLLETRKTTPGLRLYEKYAVRIAGARNHRHGLDTGCMLKENHLRSIGSIEAAIQNLKKRLPILTKIEIEVTNLREFSIALEQGADVIMLDNFSLEDVKIAVQERNAINPYAKLELSGNLDEKNMKEIALSGVDYLSMGALIHKSVWVDMSMQLYSAPT